MVHEVKQGEYLFRIARQYGFRNPDNVWSDPNNAALRDLRPNHNVLFPGDQIFIPLFRKKEVACVTTRVHKFSVDVKNLRLTLVINDANRQQRNKLFPLQVGFKKRGRSGIEQPAL